MVSRNRRIWLTLCAVGCVLVAGGALASWFGRGDEADELAAKCAGATLTPSEEVTCFAYGYLTAPIEPSPQPMPRVAGEPFLAAKKLLSEAAIEYQWLRLHERKGPPLDRWRVCHQYPKAGSSTEVEDVVVIVGATCASSYPTLNDKLVGEVERYLDREGMGYHPLDAGDDDFPETLEPDPNWTMCFLDVQQSIERTAEALTGFLYENGDVITLEGFVARTPAGCSASNEAEEQGELP